MARSSSRSVSWNCTGTCLAMASSDRTARLWTWGEGVRDAAGTVSGHTAPVMLVRYHPSEASVLATAAIDSTIRLWDVRQPTSLTHRSIGVIELVEGSKHASQHAPHNNNNSNMGASAPIALEWNPSSRSNSSILAVVERDSSIYVYDTRQLQGTRKIRQGGHTVTTSAVAVLSGRHKHSTRIEALQFLLHDSGSTLLVSNGPDLAEDGMSTLRLWNWRTSNEGNNINDDFVYDLDGNNHQSSSLYSKLRFPAHTGRIVTMALDHAADRLATGTTDASVGLWDVKSMTCTHTVSRPRTCVRSVAFSYDGLYVASGSEDDEVDVALARDGTLVGSVKVGGHRPRMGGVEEIAWHPREYALACARWDHPIGSSTAPVVIAKLQFAESQ
jgi:WD40 repeat protein